MGLSGSAGRALWLAALLTACSDVGQSVVADAGATSDWASHETAVRATLRVGDVHAARKHLDALGKRINSPTQRATYEELAKQVRALESSSL
jgi:hypothetical protein